MHGRVYFAAMEIAVELLESSSIAVNEMQRKNLEFAQHVTSEGLTTSELIRLSIMLLFPVPKLPEGNFQLTEDKLYLVVDETAFLLPEDTLKDQLENRWKFLAGWLPGDANKNPTV